MNISKTFIKIWNINIDKNINHYKAIYQVIPEKWQLLLISDGSFTRNLSIINKYTVLLKLIKQEKKFYPSQIILSKKTTKDKKKLAFSREIWLIDKKNYLIFAKSYHGKQIFNSKIIDKNKPLGLLLIESETEIYREITSIYHGYSKILERKFKTVGPFWGRSYQILYKNKILILINEFFSPTLISRT
uniref:Chorismate lyase n=1 Tax=Batrachospermum sp. TaxID=31373 RepID=A0A8K1YV65_9FLOR|nr:hypothetical protein [Batrachospermum sp.]